VGAALPRRVFAAAVCMLHRDISVSRMGTWQVGDATTCCTHTVWCWRSIFVTSDNGA